MTQLDASGDAGSPGVGLTRLVGVGSSAGGLEALIEFVRVLPRELPTAYVISQHMDPDHNSALVELLERETQLSVVLAVDGMSLKAGTIYVVPPQHDAHVTSHEIKLTDVSGQSGPTPRADVLFRSLADVWRDRAVAVVLSGTGSDGTHGVGAVRAAGGLTIAQTPSSAKFPGMPASAIDSGHVDLVLPPADMAEALARSCAAAVDVRPPNTRMPPEARGTESSPSSEELVGKILKRVDIATGLNFAGYKESTLHRQIERRLAITGTAGLQDYLHLISGDVGEANALARSMQIGVTSFFRDPDEWAALEGPLRELLEALEPTAQLRIWVPGCSTGEEAYSVAMLAADIINDPSGLGRRLKVFATDISEPSLEIARRGRYSDDAVEAIPEDRRNSWLQRSERGWEVAQNLRDCLVFARHNVEFDPGFPRVHLITFRNTLIYFKPTLQERVLHLFHLSLTPNGLLMLGAAERLTAGSDLFDPLEAKHRIYRRRPGSPRGLPAIAWGSRPADPYPAETTKLLGKRAALRDALVRRFAPPSLVIDPDHQVVEVVGDVSPWCWVAEGQPTSHVVGLLREGLRPIVRSMLVEARSGQAVERDVTGPEGSVRVSVHPLGSDALGLATVSFEPLTAESGSGGPRNDVDLASTSSSSFELQSTRLALQATIEELGASNEELQALNEELQASGEELQASNEEVQASYEELEVTNEELAVLNTELQERGHSLTRANADLENIQASLTSGLILLDSDLRITRFTPLAVRLFPLINTDIGRPLTGIPPVLAIPELAAHLRQAVNDQTTSIFELSGPTADFLVQIQPYLTAAGDSRGAIVVVTDTSDLAQARRQGRQALRIFTRSTEALREVLWHRDESGALTFISSS
ncbi:MAG: hypothetical protein F2911_09155, partial [Actinobacteria bacterium]|nr:hypothetical protein [Actinomycetota bacterium]